MRAFTEAEIGKLLKGIDIPPCPAVLGALLKEVRRDESNVARIASLISQDVALAAGVIKIANSACFAPARQVGSINEALGLLGFGSVFNFVINELLRKSISAGGSQRLERFWDSAAHTALVSARLTSALPGTLRDNAYCFGLFHDCGIPLMMKRFPDYRETLKLANGNSGTSFTRIEETRHGTQHAVIGHLLARSWGLAEPVTQAILCHHDYTIFQASDGLPKESVVLIGINLIAERVVALHLKQKGAGEWERGRQAVGDYFGLTQAGLAALVDDMLYQLGPLHVA